MRFLIKPIGVLLNEIIKYFEMRSSHLIKKSGAIMMAFWWRQQHYFSKWFVSTCRYVCQACQNWLDDLNDQSSYCKYVCGLWSLRWSLLLRLFIMGYLKGEYWEMYVYIFFFMIFVKDPLKKFLNFIIWL